MATAMRQSVTLIDLMAGLSYLEGVQLLIGGLITLAVTAVVQILIIPAVQRRTRALDRWEKDVIELMTLINEDLDDKLAEFRLTLDAVLISEHLADKLQKDSGKPLSAEVNAPVDESWDTLQQLWEEVRELSTKTLKTLRRCGLIHPWSPYWFDFYADLNRFKHEVWKVYPRAHRRKGHSSGAENLERALPELTRIHDQLSSKLEAITQPIKPPKQSRKFRRALLKHGRKPIFR
jgi:hypothetical protein